MDYREASRRSIHKDFKHNEKREVKRVEQLPEQGAKRRILFVGGEYAKYARFLVGKLVKLHEKEEDLGGRTWKIEFVFDEDRKSLNNSAGWSDSKRYYILEGVKFK